MAFYMKQIENVKSFDYKTVNGKKGKRKKKFTQNAILLIVIYTNCK